MYILHVYIFFPGIQVRIGGSDSFYMHHKFAIVDDCHLINGSFNWSRSAITWNNENLLLTNHPEVVGTYKREFEKLWAKYEPRGAGADTRTR